MKLLDCRDVLPECDMVFTGDDEDEVIAHVSRHAARSHGCDPAVLAASARSHIVTLH